MSYNSAFGVGGSQAAFGNLSKLIKKHSWLTRLTATGRAVVIEWPSRVYFVRHISTYVPYSNKSHQSVEPIAVFTTISELPALKSTQETARFFQVIRPIRNEEIADAEKRMGPRYGRTFWICFHVILINFFGRHILFRIPRTKPCYFVPTQ